MVIHEVRVFASRGGAALLALGALCGCALVGPRSIAGSRAVYAEVINSTEDEQILNVIVRQRYNETFGMMSVASVTANLRFGVQAGANFAIGRDSNFEGNLVPFSTGVAYEENPTISYIPLSGEDFMRRMLSPVTIDEWHLLSGNVENPGHVFDLAIRRINGLKNPLPGEGVPSAEFARCVELFDQLRRAAVLDIVRTSQTTTEHSYSWEMHDYKDAHSDLVDELLVLLGIKVEPDGSPIFLPMQFAVGRSDSAILLQSRSALDVLRAFGSGIEIPAPHLEARIVEPVPWPVPEARRPITIRSSRKRPDNATVRVRFRDQWFYIDATDTPSKLAFVFLRTFIGMRLADPTSHKGPVLTFPVG